MCRGGCGTETNGFAPDAAAGKTMQAYVLGFGQDLEPQPESAAFRGARNLAPGHGARKAVFARRQCIATRCADATCEWGTGVPARARSAVLLFRQHAKTAD